MFKRKSCMFFLLTANMFCRRVCKIEVPAEDCRVTERLKGKFLSVRVTARVAAPAMLDRVFAELGKDARIMMRY